MITFPNAKINIGLNIIEKRSDGFHNLESIFVPVLGLHDVLEVIPSKSENEYKFTSSGIPIDASPDDNLVVKAYKLLKADYKLPAVKIHLHKIIPSGAGLGGGSSDASFMLKMLNEMFNLDISEEKLLAYAEKLGSDCPFFIKNTTQFAQGKGEILEDFMFFIPKSTLVIIKPPIHVPTKDAFVEITPVKPTISLKELYGSLPTDWKNIAKNDFEASIFPKYREIEQIKGKLYHLGAEYASMTGSGSSVFGIFSKPIDLNNFPENHYLFV